jgi:chaperone LolA
MKKIFVAISLLVLSLAAAPQAEIDRVVAASNGMEASFTQQFTPKGFKTPQSESGTVVFGRLPAMRWTYTAPEAKTFVFDGSQSWFYVPSDKQVTVATISDQRKRDLPFLLLGDPAARAKYFDVKETSQGAATVTSLNPRDRTAPIRQVSIETDASSHLINSISYTDRDGNHTSFRFFSYHPAHLSADTFTFVAPKGVQVVRGD